MGQDSFVPELLLCSDALYAGLDILQPHVKNNRLSTSSGKIIIGVVEGDIHDIWKNLLKAVFTATGWKVHDLGKDVTCRTFTEAQQAISARQGIWRSVSNSSGSVVGRAAVRVYANIADYPFICRFQPA